MEEWNGHWACSDFLWAMIRGRRPYFLNRQPHSVHRKIMQDCGFQIVYDKPAETPSRIAKNRLARRFRTMPDNDLITSGAFMQAVKKGGRE